VGQSSIVAHVHGASSDRGARRLALVLGLTATFAAAELAAGLISESLALQADAAHMFTDVLALALALGAVRLARRPPTRRATYGYHRFEILAALANALLLILVAVYIGYEAWERIQAPHSVPGLTLLVALAGLVVNVIGLRVLHGAAHADGSLNLRAATVELFSDALASLAVLAAALVTMLTGWVYADTLFAVAIVLLILPRAWQLIRAAIDVLLEATPGRIDVAELESALLGVPGVWRVHDLHVWSITSGFEVMSGHAEVEPSRARPALAEMRSLLRDRFGIEHATIQIDEATSDEACVGADCTGSAESRASERPAKRPRSALRP
jgi:cobalt-zinc-cadmium efflux system protein